MLLARDSASGQPESPISRHRYLYANTDPVNNRDPTGLFSIGELAVEQMLERTLEVADIASHTMVICRATTQLEFIGSTMMWGGLAASAITIALWGDDIPGKTGWSLRGKNYGAVGNNAVSEVDMRWEPPAMLKFAFKFGKAKWGPSISVGAKGISGGVSYSHNFYTFGACGGTLGFGVGAVNGKMSGKVGANKSEKTGGVAFGGGGMLSVEREALKIFRVEYPVFEFGSSTDKGWGLKLGGINPWKPAGDKGKLLGY